MTSPLVKPDPKLDLVLERDIDVPVELVWQAWTTPESIKHWFCPKPWMVTSCDVDLRVGGAFSFTMRSPEGQEFPNVGCYLDIVPNQRLIWTDTLLPGFRPAPKPFFTAALYLEPKGSGTRYIAMAIHGNEETRATHEKMGFHEGWGTVLNQLVAHIKASMH
jgi:uncharacterized protein YndB with AHSA1/START domain